MIRGTVNAKREAVLTLRLRGPTGVEVEVDAVIDTGFTGTLTATAAVVAHLGLVPDFPSRAVLADGSVVKFDTYEEGSRLERRFTAGCDRGDGERSPGRDEVPGRPRAVGRGRAGRGGRGPAAAATPSRPRCGRNPGRRTGPEAVGLMEPINVRIGVDRRSAEL